MFFHSNGRPHHIIIMSMIVFVILNFVENLIYVNGGRIDFSSKELKSYFRIPSMRDLLIIIAIMLLFAFLQGLFTNVFSHFY